MKLQLILALLIIPLWSCTQQEKNYNIRTIAFYNVENLFDTENDSLTFDDDRTPDGKYRWTLNRYEKKIAHISKVLSEIGTAVAKRSPDIIGLCEIENKQVIEDLVNSPILQDKSYGIIHFNSPDERGIDVALLYKKSIFLPTSSTSHRLVLKNDNDKRNYTRDQLVVGGLLDDEQIYFIVNHWPSRSGGITRSKPNRIAAAKLNKRIIDSLQRLEPNAKLINMGDFNDNPNDDSLKKILKTKDEKKNIEPNDLFNPMEKRYKKGGGSLAYRDKWFLFDQIFFTENLIDKAENKYRFWKAGIFDAPYLIVQKGKYKGYPFRTYAGGNYIGGYSDHFPVYIHLIREATNDP